MLNVWDAVHVITWQAMVGKLQILTLEGMAMYPNNCLILLKFSIEMAFQNIYSVVPNYEVTTSCQLYDHYQENSEFTN